MSIFKQIYCSFVFLWMAAACFGQKEKAPVVTVKDSFASQRNLLQKLHFTQIDITGTKQTKNYIVLREIQFRPGDSVSTTELDAELVKARQQVYNTTLFDDVRFNAVIDEGNGVEVKVTVKERWYIYPTPQFQLVDRNFNEWFNTYNHSFDRVNYGVKFVHYNLSGRRDQLRIYLINGYSRNVSFSYSNPYSNKKLTAGFSISGGYTQNREIAYRTNYYNKSLFYPVKPAGTKIQTGDFVRNSWFLAGAYNIRRGLFKRHSIALGYSFLKVDDSVVTSRYNPHYFNSTGNSRGFFDLSYVFSYSNVNNVSYPLTGLAGYFAASKRGFGLTGGINMFTVEAGISKYINFKKTWFLSFQLNGRIKLPFDQPYLNQRALGYGENYLRGLEYYVIDGVATTLFKSTLKKKLVAFNIPFPFFPRLLTRIPFTIYAKTFGDLGYSYNKKQYNAYLNNRMLYSGGFGVDILTLYDINFKLEYSFNQLGERGLFFHTQNGF